MANDLLSEVLAHNELAQAGSVMAKPQKPEWRKNLSPLTATILNMLDTALSFGPNPLDAAGGGQQGAGIFRELALQRQGGSMNPAQFAARLMEQPRFARYKQLVENMARRGLGEKATVYRGHGADDPLFKALQTGQLPSATAVSTKKSVAKGFADEARAVGMRPQLAEMQITPESILALTPKRGTTYGNEAELIIDPRWAESINVANMLPSFKGPGLVESTIDDTLNTLLRTQPARPLPGSGSHAALGVGNEKMTSGIVEQLKKALAEAEKPPLYSQTKPKGLDDPLEYLSSQLPFVMKR